MKKILIITTALFMLFACGKERESGEMNVVLVGQQTWQFADSLILATFNAGDFQRGLTLADSLVQAGDISELQADYARAHSYLGLGDRVKAKVYFHQATAVRNPSHEDLWTYLSAAYALSNMFYREDNYEGALHEALPALAVIDSLHIESPSIRTGLYNIIASCQLNQREVTLAKKNFERAYNMLRVWLATDSTAQNKISAFNVCLWNAYEYYEAKEYDEANVWMSRTDSLKPSLMAASDRLKPGEQESTLARVELFHALISQGLGQKREAAKAYERYRKMTYAHTDDGRLLATEYLIAARRYDEAADQFDKINKVKLEGKGESSIETIRTLYLPKLLANLYSGRRDSARYVAGQLVEKIDSAWLTYKRKTMAELTTVYDTESMERKIAEQEARLLRQRAIGMGVSLLGLIVLFVSFTWVRHRAAKRLAEVRAENERIEGELSIARDIQMSMLSNRFPKREGLDLYAEMSPARMVGGDLYAYVLNGRRSSAEGQSLYFCVGDVSGKGVPASLFMAQSARLFKTLAKEGMTPADIAFRMNNELAENNEQCMFVTIFIGLVNLATGRLDFCNCGHNAPIVDGEFLEMAYKNKPLGLMDGIPYKGESIDDIRGRQILLYTDGLNEAENHAHDRFGNERMLKLMSTAASLSAKEVIAQFTEAVTDFRDGAEPSDDLTLMCLRIN